MIPAPRRSRAHRPYAGGVSSFAGRRLARRNNGPVLILAGLQGYDAVTSLIPVTYVKKCLDDVGLPEPIRWVIPVVKAASVAGLVGGLRSPALGRATSIGLLSYFVLAVGAHVRARDFGRNFAAANIMLVTVAAVTMRFWTDPTVSRTGMPHRGLAWRRGAQSWSASPAARRPW